MNTYKFTRYVSGYEIFRVAANTEEDALACIQDGSEESDDFEIEFSDGLQLEAVEEIK